MMTNSDLPHINDITGRRHRSSDLYVSPLVAIMTTEAMAPGLTSLSPEILHEICLNVDPVDLAALARTNKHLNGIVNRDDLLWKLQYLDLLVSSTWRLGTRLTVIGWPFRRRRSCSRDMAGPAQECRVDPEDTRVREPRIKGRTKISSIVGY
jgi:hypothetical protein